MWDFSIAKALGLMIRTAPFLIFRALVYFGIAAALVIATGAGAGTGYGIGLLSDEEFRTTSTLWGGIAGFGLTAGVIFFLRDYLLYLVKAGQIAVMVDYLDGKPLPYGQGQIAYARAVVTERFVEGTHRDTDRVLQKEAVGNGWLAEEVWAADDRNRGTAPLIPVVVVFDVDMHGVDHRDLVDEAPLTGDGPPVGDVGVAEFADQSDSVKNRDGHRFVLHGREGQLIIFEESAPCV